MSLQEVRYEPPPWSSVLPYKSVCGSHDWKLRIVFGDTCENCVVWGAQVHNYNFLYIYSRNCFFFNIMYYLAVSHRYFVTGPELKLLSGFCILCFSPLSLFMNAYTTASCQKAQLRWFLTLVHLLDGIWLGVKLCCHIMRTAHKQKHNYKWFLTPRGSIAS